MTKKVGNKTYLGIFLAICLIICLIPSVFMIFFPSEETIGNERQTIWPSVVTEDGALNSRILPEMGAYFESHYAFRPQLITADARLQAPLFQVSNTDPVIVGQDGWLYYSSTLKDYLGREPLSDRGMWNLAHNVALIQNYVQAMGAKFLFMVPPNKNSLYPEQMPYYYGVRESEESNLSRLASYLEDTGVRYLDVAGALESQEEILYLKEDSHWNEKGAMMVYDLALDMLEKEHETWELVPGGGREGDLGNMIYPAEHTEEPDDAIDMQPQYDFIPNPSSSDPVSVEDFQIETDNPAASETLLMYRDSFGNTLIPLFSNAFAHSYYDRSANYLMAKAIQQYQPQYVVLELVERNLSNLVSKPAVIPAPRRNPDPETIRALPQVQTTIERSRSDANFVEFSGAVPEEDVAEHGKIYLQITMPDGTAGIYEAFTVTAPDPAEAAGLTYLQDPSGNPGTEGGQNPDYGYLLYLPLTQFGTIEDAQASQVEIYAEESTDEVETD